MLPRRFSHKINLNTLGTNFQCVLARYSTTQIYSRKSKLQKQKAFSNLKSRLLAVTNPADPSSNSNAQSGTRLFPSKISRISHQQLREQAAVFPALIKQIHERGLGSWNLPGRGRQRMQYVVNALRSTPSAEALFDLKVRPNKLIAGSVDEFPEENLTEVCFVGRSNCGKSSLLNSILMRPLFCPVSETPGTTRSAVFCTIRNSIRIIDLPGYGYAQVDSKEAAKFRELISAVLRRKSLVRVYLLVDCKQNGLSDDDKELLKLFRRHNSALRVNIVLTKTDLEVPLELARTCTLLAADPALRALRFSPATDIIMLSSETLAGVYLLRNTLASLCKYRVDAAAVVEWRRRENPLAVLTDHERMRLKNSARKLKNNIRRRAARFKTPEQLDTMMQDRNERRKFKKAKALRDGAQRVNSEAEQSQRRHHDRVPF